MPRETIIDGDMLEAAGVEGRRKRRDERPPAEVSAPQEGTGEEHKKEPETTGSSVEGRRSSSSPTRPKFKKGSDADIFDTSR
ncbi:MAG: hypothetical protein ACP5C4_05975 [Methanomicrobiales archaeon]